MLGRLRQITRTAVRRMSTEVLDPRHPWDKQEGESSSAHVAFQAYLEIGPSRSLNAAYASRCQKGGERVARRKAPGVWQRWSRTHNWPERAAEWDGHLAKRVREGFADALRDHAAELGAATIKEYYNELRRVKKLANAVLECTERRVGAARLFPHRNLQGDASAMRTAAETLGLANRDLLAILGHPQLFALLVGYDHEPEKSPPAKGAKQC